MSDAEENKTSSSVYVDLAKMAQASIFNRRAHEWKVAFGLWTGIGVLTYFILSNSEKFPRSPATFLGIVYVIFSLLWLFLWLAPHRRAFHLDQEWEHYYMHMAEGVKAQQPRSIAYWEIFFPRGKQLGWVYGQFLVTVLLLIVSWRLIADSTAARTDRKTVVDQPIPNSDMRVQVLKNN